jgi:eukaryotic-like serine/threonine-protein kinase
LQEYAGGGGMGAVYSAVDLVSKARVAVKILKPDLVVRNSRNAISFQREVAAARTLDHPNIVRVLDSGVSDDVSFMVMEWLDGQTLEDLLAQEQLPIIRVIDLFKQICDALITAHSKSIIHLDIKPANIFLSNSQSEPDQVKVIDFGMARVLSNETGTTVTRFLGTYHCSPEHFGGKVTYRSDIYSLGATLYHLIAGVVPFGTSYINAKMHPDLDFPRCLLSSMSVQNFLLRSMQ